VLKLNRAQQQIIPNGIGFREITESKELTMQRLGILHKFRIVFGVVGVMEKRKGHQYLLESLNLIKELKKVPDNEFIVLIEGTGGILQELMEFSDRNDLSGYVKFIGAESNVFNFMSAIDVLIFPALGGEDFPNVVSEAMLLGKAVISSNVSGANIQVIDGVTGYLVEVGSKEQLANAIMNIVRDPNLIYEFGVKGRERFFENFTAEQAIRNYMKLYSTLGQGITQH
jgi:glycosyltransferase involved in cell wall biosynthesis